MQVEIEAAPAYAFGRITVGPGREVKVEAGAMASMTGDVQIETRATGGLMGGLKRSVLGGESFFVNTFRSEAGGHVAVAAKLPGDLRLLPLEGRTWFIQSGSWIASDPEVDVDTRWGGAKTFFGGEGLFLLKCSGRGDVLVSSYGAITTVDVPAGQSYVIDTGHVVAFEEGMQYGVEKAGSWKSTVFGAEGLVVRFQGPGTVWLQTRSPQDLVGWLKTQMPGQRS
ncbi:MAG TPA: TIGR00266 family protein [Actinomycetota bacterium]|nr:TIGR00266 family protein [Actinomycetota bacterium]